MDFPSEWLRNMERLLAGEYGAFLEAMAAEPALSLRLNALRPGAASDRAGEAIPWSPWGRYLREGDDVKTGRDISHAAGVYYMQEASAQAPAEGLAPQPGEVVLDLCAAPGGKASQMAARMGGRGALVANEIVLPRARALSGNLERLGVTNAAVVSESPERLAEKWPEAFDAVLVDAPCSGEGMFRRDPDARRAWTQDSPRACAVRQAKILASARRMVRPGGRLAYATCTFNDVENEGVVRDFLGANGDFAPLDFDLPGVGRSEGGMLRLWPHRLRGDGHFVALMKREGDAAPRVRREGPGLSAARIDDLPGRWVRALEGCVIEERAGALEALPPEMPDLDGLRVIRRGLRLGGGPRRHAPPDHALAMAFGPEGFDRRAELDDGAARLFLAGEAMALDAPDGWTHISWRGHPLGFGKVSQGILKNHLPKGLRWR